MQNLNRVINDLESEDKRLTGELKRVRTAIAVLRHSSGGGGGTGIIRTRRKLSAAARKKIADAQRARWAKWKAKKAA